MARKEFYASSAYRAKQSAITKLNWQIGRMDILRRKNVRRCARTVCGHFFNAVPSDPKKYCSRSCAARVNNSNRVQTSLTRLKISKSLAGRKYPNRPKAPPKFSSCLYPLCGKIFEMPRGRPLSKPGKYCSRSCAIKHIGGKPTSPRAARAKAGVRIDINPMIYFFSRWEANFARLMNFLKIKWVHQPKTFQLTSQKYTPDFYLPEYDAYVEIKNFLSDYSKNRDLEFRTLYPALKLILILKKDYLELQNEYAHRIPTWEYSN